MNKSYHVLKNNYICRNYLNDKTMKVKKIKPEVIEILKQKFGYDFDSEFWTDEMLLLADEIYTATDYYIKSNN